MPDHRLFDSSGRSPIKSMAEGDNISNRLRLAMETVFFREADALLRKWKASGNRLLGTSVSVGFAFRFRGVVIETNEDECVIQNSSGENLIIKFPQVRHFQIEKRSNEIASTLHLSLNTGIEIVLSEDDQL